VTSELERKDAAAVRSRRVAEGLQAGYLLLLLVPPVLALVEGTVDARVGAGLLLVALVARLVLRRIGPDADWVRARTAAEEARSRTWFARTGDAGVPVAERWAAYREQRIDDQIDWFGRRRRAHEGAVARWRIARVVLVVGTVGVAVAVLAAPTALPTGTSALVAAVLATAEAWIQFRRRETLTVSYAAARARLEELRTPEVVAEADLAARVAAVEHALERERWTWTAIMSADLVVGRRS
jgi:hypothetical protein